MTDAQRQLLSKAAESLSAGRLLLKDGFPGFAASRAYYTMFYVAQALLLEQGLSLSKHSGVIATFGKELAKSGKVPADYHRMLIDAQELRELGDYGLSQTVSTADAQKQLDQAERFLQMGRNQLGFTSTP